MKKKMQKWLSLMLVFSLLMSMMSMSGFAASGDSQNTQASKQIQGGSNPVYYTYESADDKPDPNNDEENTTNNNVVVNGNGEDAPLVEVSKTIEATGTENLFDITLQVKTTQKIEISETSPDASVVLILDLSDSMNTNKIDGKTRFEVAKAKAIDFLKNFVQDANGAARKVAIVTFEKDGAIFNFGSKDAPVYWIDAVANDADGLNDAIVNCINGLQTDHGTNIQAGLQLARNLYDTTNTWAKPIENISNRFSVLLTDGSPTVRIVGEVSNSATSFVGTDGYNETDPPINEAKALDALTDSYAICFNSGIQSWMKTASDATIRNPKTVDKAVTAANSDQLKATFDMIINRIKLAVDAWRVTDSIPADSYLKLVSVDAGNRENLDVLDECPGAGTSGVLVWNLKKDLTSNNTKIYSNGKEVSADALEGDDPVTIVYQLKYRVQLNNADENFEAGKYYLTNGITKLDYYLLDSNGNFIKDNGDTVEAEDALLTQYFKIPAVKGYTAKLAFTKVGPQGEELQNAQFALTNGANWKDVATSDADGKVAFTKWIPSGDSYTLTETAAPNGYKAIDPVEFTLSYGEGLPYTSASKVEDKLQPDYTDVTITKTWRSPNGVTPESITVTLKQNGVAMADYTDIVINKSDCTVNTLTGVWTYTFKDLIALDEKGNTYTYTVEEEVPEDYKVEGQDTLNLINTATGKVNVIVTKEWLLPDTMNTTTALVDVILYANGVEADREENVNDGRTVSFMNLEKYDENGQTIFYTVGEESEASYQQVGIDKIAEAGPTTMYTIVNTVAEEYDATVSGSKIWKDDNDVNARPESITVALYADGEAVVDGDGNAVTATVTAADNWKYSFSGLQRYNFIRSEAGRIIGVQEIVYTVQEVSEVDGYESSAVGTDIINTRVDTVDFTVTKEWAVDLGDAEHGAVSAILYANGHPVAESEPFVESYTFEGLDKYDTDGVAIVYDVIEVPVDGYTATYSDVTTDEYGNYAQTITNTRDDADDTLTITVTKVWKQPGDVEAKTATFQLYKGDEETDKFLQITGNGVGYFENLPRYEEVTVVVSEPEVTEPEVVETETTEPEPTEPEVVEVVRTELVEIDYNVKEIDIPENYKKTFENEETADSSGNFTCNFVNTITGTTDIFVEKSWVKPTSVTAPEITVSVQVYDLDKGEWVALDDGIVIESGESNGSMKNLPAYDADGRRMSYRVTELSVPGYSSAVNGGYNSETGDYEYSIVNSINPSNSEITVSKVWLDGNRPAADRPSVTLQLLRDGQEYDTVEFWYDAAAEKVMATTKYDTVDAVVSEDGNTYSVKLNVSDYSDDLTMKYAYSVAEWTVPEGYTGVVSGYTATNTRVGTIDIDVTKYWTDPGDMARPDITLTLTGKVGDEIVETYDILVSDDTGIVVATMGDVELDVDANGNTWTITAADLNQYHNGSKITYTLSEGAVDGYTAQTVDGQPFAINNIIDQEYVSVSAEKIWANMDAEGVYTPRYPDSITVALFRDGVKVEGSEQIATLENEYVIESYTNLEKYAPNGARYTYQILELNQNGVQVNDNGTISFGSNNDYAVTYGEDGTITNTFIVPAKYMWIVKTNYIHKNYDGTILLDWGTQTEVYTETESKTITVDPADEVYARCPQDGNLYDLDTSKTNITSVDLENENHLYELVLNYILIEEQPPAPPTPPAPPSSDTYLNVKKVWVGDNEDIRPESIDVQLLRDGEAYGDSVTLNEENGWKASWSGLSKSYDWSVEEVEIPVGYTSAVTNAGKNWTITNTLDVIEIPEEDIPQTDLPDEEPELEDIFEEDIPLADVPKTGDATALWMAMNALSGTALAGVSLLGRKKREDEEI